MTEGNETFKKQNLERFEKMQNQLKEFAERIDQAEMKSAELLTKEQLHEYREEFGRKLTEAINQIGKEYEEKLQAAHVNKPVATDTDDEELTDELDRITGVIYSDPELRELYNEDREEAITLARIKMFENAETELVPATSKPEDGFGFPRK